ncbi:NADH-quinone oxidoreductase subunit L [Buchnera aphidicola (Neophyllaphis varicolor)]|uniref:NADH-quinone oxidoreductase subunit L n=1 Tax=Buchnera aphidicola TaxID=9 RepID=UPI0031B83224
MNLIYFVILFPLISFLFLSLSYKFISKSLVSKIGVGSVLLSTLISFYLVFIFFNQSFNLTVFNLYNLITIDKFNISFNLLFDHLSITMLLLITIVGLLIHIFSVWYMNKDAGYIRFFSYINLFIFSMIILVLSDNLICMYFGWELVSICSYLLIGFYYTEIENTKSAMKAFIVTRIGDIFLILSMFMIYYHLGTLNLSEIIQISNIDLYKHNSFILSSITLFLLLGSIGKSAQIPLHTWLSDAMVGPTPVSALIHAATMVTAGVYLIVRTHNLFSCTPQILFVISVIGSVTLLVGSFSALVQTDIKKILAYSTMSQLGYMFLSMGFNGWNAAVFHLVTHAIFKALLFLSAGSLILFCKHEQNIFKINVFYKKIPFIYACFLIGSLSLCSFPFITSGFYSKEYILLNMLLHKSFVFLSIGLLGAFITVLYTFRMIYILFHSNKKYFFLKYNNLSISHYLPLIVLLFLSCIFGYLVDCTFDIFFINNAINKIYKIKLEIFSTIIIFLALLISILCLVVFPKQFISFTKMKYINKICNFLLFGFKFDYLYEKIFVNLYFKIIRIISSKFLYAFYGLPILFIKNINTFMILSVNGLTRWYITSTILNLLIIIVYLLFYFYL